jgi:hypothetical protein
MSSDTKPAQKRIDQFFSGPGGRADDWRDLVEAAMFEGRFAETSARNPRSTTSLPAICSLRKDISRCSLRDKSA